MLERVGDGDTVSASLLYVSAFWLQVPWEAQGVAVVVEGALSLRY